MAISNGYCTAAELTARITKVSATDMTAQLELAIETASRHIDQWCNRRFFLDGSATARTYLTGAFYAPAVIGIDDFDPATVPTVKSDDDGDGTFETTWTVSTDYQFEPLNPNRIESSPQNQIRLLGSRFLRVPIFGRPQLQVTAKWGYPAVPIAIKSACEILAEDYYKMKDAPFGVAGSSEFGVYRVNENKTVTSLLAQYRLPSGIS